MPPQSARPADPPSNAVSTPFDSRSAVPGPPPRPAMRHPRAFSNAPPAYCFSADETLPGHPEGADDAGRVVLRVGRGRRTVRREQGRPGDRRRIQRAHTEDARSEAATASPSGTRRPAAFRAVNRFERTLNECAFVYGCASPFSTGSGRRAVDSPVRHLFSHLSTVTVVEPLGKNSTGQFRCRPSSSTSLSMVPEIA